MTTWSSSVLLTKFNQLAGRPASGDAITDPQKYQRLTDAQNAVIDDIAVRCPQSLYQQGSYSTLTTTDNKIFTFGTDANGDPLFPYGKVGIYPSLASMPDAPWTEGFDYLNEGDQIRIPNNRTFTGTLYWRGIQTPADITSSQAASLVPPQSRILIALKATQQFALEGNRNPDLASAMDAEYQKEFARWCLVWKTQFRSGGALAPLVSSFAGNPAWVGGFNSLGGF